MARVWLAEDTRHGRKVAVKILHPDQSDGFAAERFLREIEIAARLQHPHIVPLLDSGEAGGLLYLVMPYIEGESLRHRLVREGRLPVGDVIRILADVADALAYAHDRGVLHRDIKPDNILLAGRHALVTDFGVAKAVSMASSQSRELTGGLAIGTPAYMAPEQALAEPDLDGRADLYALSVVGYELLCGEPPFLGEMAQAVLAAQVLDAPAPVTDRRPDTPIGLAALLARGLAKQRTDRWANAHDMVRALDPLLTPTGGTTPAGVAPVGRRGSLLWLGLGALVLAGLAIAGYLARPQASVGPGFTERQVTFSGVVYSAAISPDGQSLAFVAESAGTAWLKVRDTRGGSEITLARADRMGLVSWSTDGSEVRVLCLDALSSYFQVVPRLGGSPRIVKTAPWSMLSPDGTTVMELPQGLDSIQRRDLETGAVLRGARDKGWWYGPPAWSADGAWTAAPTIQQTRGTSRLVLISTSDLHQVVVLEDSVALSTPAWDGRQHALYYLRLGGRLADLYRVELGRDGRARSAPVLIRAGIPSGAKVPNSGFESPVSVSSDGSQLVYVQLRLWSNIGLIDFGDWRAHRAPLALTAGSSLYHWARWSGDGQSIVLLRDETDATVLQLLPSRGGVAQEIARFPSAWASSWSPDGRRLLVQYVDPDSGKGLGVYSLPDRVVRSRYFKAVGSYPEWLDDTTVVAPSPGNRYLLRLPLGAGPVRPLPGIDTVGWTLLPRRSPDGRYLAFAWNPGKGRVQLQLYGIRDSSSRTLWPTTARPVGWSRDSRTVFALHDLADSVEVMALPRDGGAPRVLATFPSSMQVFDVLPDGKHALLNLNERQADAWLLRLPPRR